MITLMALEFTRSEAKSWAIFEEIMVTHVIKTGFYTSAIAYMKARFEMVGLKAGTILPPVEPLSGARRE